MLSFFAFGRLDLSRWWCLAPIAATLLITGCAGQALVGDYDNYSIHYPEAVNRQLLLNLVRLHLNEPPYFIQLGTISSQISMNSSLSFSPSNLTTTHPGGVSGPWNASAWTLGGMLGLQANEVPQFQFVPLNGDTFSQAITVPISDKVFLSYYSSGWPIDQLMRVLVSSINVDHSQDAFANCPYTSLQNDPNDDSYPDFLAVCYNYHVLESYGLLQVDKADKTSQTLVLNATNAKLSDIVTAVGAGFKIDQPVLPGTKTPDETKIDVTLPTPQTYKLLSLQSGSGGDATDKLIVTAKSKFALFSWQRGQHSPLMSSWNPSVVGSAMVVGEAGRVHPHPGFLTTEAIKTIQSAAISAETTGKASDQIYSLFSVSSISGNPSANGENNPTPAKNLQLRTRTFIEILNSLAKEDDGYAKHGNESPEFYPKDGDTTIYSTVKPMLTMIKPALASKSPYDSLVDIDYEGKTYTINDADNPPNGLGPTKGDAVGFSCSDKRTFILLSYLFADINIDPKKLPIQQVIVAP